MGSPSSIRRRLLFLTVNSSYSHSSLALPLLHSACRDLENWEWIRYDMTLKDDVMKAVRAIYSSGCDLLAADLYLFNRNMALEVLERYHALDPGCRIVAGGPECLGEGAGELLQQYPFLDAVFRGEGEESFCHYLTHFEDPPSHRIFPPEGNGIFQEWNSSPYPVRDPFFVTEKPFVQIETARGCPMQCFYCTSGGTGTRYRTLEQVREELSLLAAKGVRDIRVLDRTFNLPQERGAALLRMFREEFPQIRFHLELHPQFMNEIMQEELRQALPGQLHIEAGIQCLDPEVLHLCGRHSKVEEVKAGLQFLCTLSAFETHADLLAGLPGESWSHILADAAILMRFRVSEIQLEVLKALPGTPLREIAGKYGIIYSPHPPYDVMMTDTMTLEEMQYARDLSRLLDMTYNHRSLHCVILEMEKGFSLFLPELLAFFHRAGGNSTTLWDLKKRFLFLFDFCSLHHLESSLPLLALQWLKAGFPPGEGADKYSEKLSFIPPEAELCQGDAACLYERETRYYVITLEKKRCYLAFNRSYAQNLPAAVWEADL